MVVQRPEGWRIRFNSRLFRCRRGLDGWGRFVGSISKVFFNIAGGSGDGPNDKEPTDGADEERQNNAERIGRHSAFDDANDHQEDSDACGNETCFYGTGERSES